MATPTLQCYVYRQFSIVSGTTQELCKLLPTTRRLSSSISRSSIVVPFSLSRSYGCLILRVVSMLGLSNVLAIALWYTIRSIYLINKSSGRGRIRTYVIPSWS